MKARAFLRVFFAGLLAASASLAGDLGGTVVFKGKPSASKSVTSAKDASVCGNKHTEFPQAEVGPLGGLKDVVVQILGVADTRPAGQAKLDQQKCSFVPDVLILPAGWTLQLTSSDPILHNTHAFWEDGTTAFNLAVPIQGMVLTWKAARAGRLKLRCDAGHTWMGGSIVVTQTPFAAVTKEDGAFSFKGVPAGTYTVEAWHPLLGSRTQKVIVGPTPSALTFEFAGS